MLHPFLCTYLVRHRSSTNYAQTLPPNLSLSPQKKKPLGGMGWCRGRDAISGDKGGRRTDAREQVREGKDEVGGGRRIGAGRSKRTQRVVLGYVRSTCHAAKKERKRAERTEKGERTASHPQQPNLPQKPGTTTSQSPTVPTPPTCLVIPRCSGLQSKPALVLRKC